MSQNTRMVICRNCNSPIAANTKICPACGAKNKSPFYKKWWFILLVIVVAAGVISSADSQKKKKTEEMETLHLSEPDDTGETMEPEQKPENETSDEDINEPESAESDETEKSSGKKDSKDGIRAEFKKAMDSYEDFMNEYCDFMKKYNKSNGTDVGLLNDYADYMSKYADVVKDFEAWDNSEMNAEEAAYYLDVQTRINKKLLKAAE